MGRHVVIDLGRCIFPSGGRVAHGAFQSIGLASGATTRILARDAAHSPSRPPDAAPQALVDLRIG